MKDIYKLIKQFPEMIKEAYNLEVPKLSKIFSRVVIIGMGGSYIVGLTLKEILKEENIFVEVYPGDLYPVDKNSLVILISYSGNTKEILNAFDKLNKDTLLALTSGGELLRKAKRKKVKIIQIPENLHQRFVFAYCFFPLLKFFEQTRIIKNKKRMVNRIIKTLIKNSEKLERDAIYLAIKLKNETPLFYSSGYFYPAAYRLQTSIEEDAKIICHSNKITELFHNELEALPASYFFPVLILDKGVSKFKKQISFFKKQIKDFYEIKYNHYSREERMFLLFYFADFLSYHLSRLKGEEMGETPLSDKIKKL